MSEIITPALPVWASDLIMASATLGYGMYWERYFTPWASVIMNICVTTIFLTSNALPLLVIYALIAYIAIGFLVAVFSVSWLKDLFGTKILGALTITACFGEIRFLEICVEILSPINAFFNYANIFLLSWLIIGIAATIVSAYVFGKKGNKNKRWGN